MAFAIVGRAAVLPGALSAEALGRRLLAGDDLLSDAPEGRWGIGFDRALSSDPSRSADRAWSRRGGYVSGFESVFNPAGLALGDVDLSRLDPLFQWVTHCAGEALRPVQRLDRRRTGLLLGNLSFPTRGMSRLAESTWWADAPDDVRAHLDLDRAEPLDRLMSGLPAQLAARAHGLGGPALCLDAACASSLYAIRLACDRLADGDCDVALAGAVSRSDDLFIHVGFCSLQALSRSGRSRPFHPEADGLVPAEGCVVVALKRLEDAERDGDTIHGVIRAVGLSNDGRAGGILAPDADGQERCMRAAYEAAGWDPADLGLLECHATGTPVGDKVEIRSAARVFAGARRLPIGSIKSNLGHPITAAGGAALLKVLAAFAAGVRPPSLHAPDRPPVLEGTPFRLLRAAEAWDGPKRAAVSAFGFGGNNAHLLVEAYTPEMARKAPARRQAAVGVVAMAVRASDLPDTAAFEAAIIAGTSALGPDGGRAEVVRLPLAGLRFPPNDLKQTLPQQLLVLSAALEAAAAAGPLPRTSTGVFVGMGADNEVCRYGARWRLAEWGRLRGWSDTDLAAQRDAVVPLLSSAGVVGTMPNIPANRLQTQLDLAGPGFTVSAEERSGTEALRLAVRELAAGRLDAAVVGAVDLGCEPVHAAALAALGRAEAPGDAAVVLVLRRVEDARALGLPVLAVVEEAGAVGGSAGAVVHVDGATLAPSAQLGHAHAASGLVAVAAAIAAVSHRARPGPDGPVVGAGEAWVDVVSTPGGGERWRVVGDQPRSFLAGPRPLLVRFAAADAAGLLARVRAAQPGGQGGCRLAIVAHDPAELAARAGAAAAAIAEGRWGCVADGAWATAGPLGGPVAVLPVDVGAGLALAFPGLADPTVAGWLEAVARAPVVRVGSAERPPGASVLVGPPGTAARWVDGAVVALTVDPADPGRAARAVFEAAGACWALGVDVDVAAVDGCLPGARGSAGAELVLPAHAAPVPVPERGGGRNRMRGAAMGAELMKDGADGPVVDGAALLGGGEAPRIVRLPDDPAAPRTAAVTPAVTGNLGALAAMQAEVARAHASFMAASSEAHLAFLGMRERTMGMAVGGTARSAAPPAAVSPAPRPAPAVSPPPARPIPSSPAPTAPAAAVRPAAAIPAPAAISAPPATRPAAVVPAGHQAMPAAPRLPAITAEGRAAPVSAAAPVAVAPAAPKAALAPAAAPSRASGSGLVDTLALARRPSSELTGLKLDRRGLEVHAGGAISTIFGPQFARQDGYFRQVRMPEPPLLLADRVVGLEGPPGVLGKGVVWTETDVSADSWYLHQGRIPAGVMIEAGQADLLLISWMGIDFLNQSERAYRLLGCTLTYHDRLPKIGDTLRYAIAVDGHAQHGDVRLFFFHYDAVVDGRPALSVRGGQAGFFTEAELAESAGVLWDAETGEHAATARVDAPAVRCTRSSFGRAEVEAYAAGDPATCFGPGFELTRTHNDTPRISAPPMLFFHEVTAYDPAGGPWGRGYLRARWKVAPDDWFFQGHFKNDPCMPGTLMFEGCLQALAFYLAGLGYTIPRDGWRFEPVTGEPIAMRCRGQVLPSASELIYEVFVEEVHSGPEPTVFADLLCTVDGLKAFHARRCGLRLSPSWPMDYQADALLAGHVDPEPVAVVDGFRFDYRAMLACAWGRPSEAFGPMYKPFDGPRTVPRLPGPPYHFVTRATHLEGPIGGMKVGSKVQIAYDIPSDAWYFDQNGAQSMPFCVLLEAALQPCGWLASYIGSALTADEDLFFRNLDGTGTLVEELVRPSGTMLTDVTLTQLSRSAGMIIVGFDVTCTIASRPVYLMKTVFGFFPAASLAQQKGLPVSEEQRLWRESTSPRQVDVTQLVQTGTLRLPERMLRMIDRVDVWPAVDGKVRLRSAKDIVPDEWMFKAHFFQDPVQPGSLGIEAMITLLQWWMIDNDLGAGMARPRFEPLALDAAMTWKYRGQVTPRNKLMNVTLEVTGHGRDARGAWATADASLWCDGLRIYHATNLMMRIVDGDPPGAGPLRGERTQTAATSAPAAFAAAPVVSAPVIAGWDRVDPAVDAWVGDHRPTWTVPALPMTVLIDRMVRAAMAARPGRTLARVESAEALRWVTVEGPVELTADVVDVDAERSKVKLHRDHHTVAEATLRWGEPGAPLEPWRGIDGDPVTDLYTSGSLFHGPTFQLVTALKRGPRGATATLDLGADGVDRGALRPGVLDAALHAIPHDDLNQWFPDLPRGMAAYPSQVRDLVIYEALPTSGALRVEVRPMGMQGRWPVCGVQIIAGDRVVASLRLWEVLLPKGPLGEAAPGDRQRFLRDRAFVPGMALSKPHGDSTMLEAGPVRTSDWLPGTVAAIYGVRSDDVVREVAVREHAAGRFGVHPSAVVIDGDRVTTPTLPCTALTVKVTGTAGRRFVAGEPSLDLTAIEARWRAYFGVDRWPTEDLYYSLVERFVEAVEVVDPAGFAALSGRPAIYLANHQTGVESLLFSMVVGGLTGVPVVTIAKAEHRQSWLGRLIELGFQWPKVCDPRVIAFFERDNKEDLGRILRGLGEDMAAGSHGMLVHVEGTRATSCATPVQTLSGAMLDLAIGVGVPVVPVRFVGGLPREPLRERVEFPVGMGKQRYVLGAPILPETLAALPLKARKQAVLDAINGLAPTAAVEAPLPGDAALGLAASAWSAARGVDEAHAVMWEVLRRSPRRCPSTARLVRAVEEGGVAWADTAEDRWLAELARRLGASA